MRTIIFNSVRDIYYRQKVRSPAGIPPVILLQWEAAPALVYLLEHKIESDMHKSARQARKPQPTKTNLIRRQNNPQML